MPIYDSGENTRKVKYNPIHAQQNSKAQAWTKLERSPFVSDSFHVLYFQEQRI